MDGRREAHRDVLVAVFESLYPQGRCTDEYPMTILQSKINPRSDEFQANHQAMQQVVTDLREKVETIHQGGGPEYQKRHTERGKLLPRERINKLLDEGSPFLEIGQFAAYDVYREDVHGAGVIADLGRVSGTECMVVANAANDAGDDACGVDVFA